MSSARILRSSARWIKENLKLYPISVAQMESTEKSALSYLKTPYKTRHVNIGPVVGQEDCKIWTLSMNESAKKTPIVLIHGLAQGVAFWAFNLDAIAKERPLYAMDMPGFGRSSRPDFSTDSLEAEKQFVDCVEAWREKMKLEKFILLGLSMGGFVSTSYAFSFPNRLSHLILVEPWGFPSKPKGAKAFFAGRVPLPLPSILHPLAHYMVKPVNCMLFLRLGSMCRLGTQSILSFQKPLFDNFTSLGPNGPKHMADYLVQANCQKPSGEAALHSMMSTAGVCWARFPMRERIPESLDERIPLTLIHGSESWLYRIPQSEMREIRPNSYVDEHVIQGGHECNVYCSDKFNEIVVNACTYCDQNSNVEYEIPSLKNDQTSSNGKTLKENGSSASEIHQNIKSLREQGKI